MQGLRWLIILGLIWLFATVSFSQQSIRVSGIVVDQENNPIPNARVTVSRGSGVAAETAADVTGRFTVEAEIGDLLVVEAPGFSTYRTRLSDRQINITLFPAQVGAVVTVTGGPTRLENSTASVVVLDSRDLRSAAAVTLDDRLRQVPGFTLFRRAGSRTANPTTQGVSLRGVGASGASRALVLADGIPLNDPFGGWIYWGRIPSESVARVEVLRGSASDLYGGSAIGGVISLVTRRPASKPLLDLETSIGSQKSQSIGGFASAALSSFRGSLAAEAFRTDGFVTVSEADRGPVDTAAGVRRSAIKPLLEYVASPGRRLFAAAEFFEEARTNGTPLQNNDTNLKNFSSGADWDTKLAGAFSIRAYAGSQSYHQSFSAIAGDRQSETLNRLQSVPSQVLGVNGQWTQSFGANLFLAGGELRQVRGRSDETVISSGRAVSLVSSGGSELTAGFFGGAVVPVGSRVTFSGGLRFDRWENTNGHSATRSLANSSSGLAVFADRNESAISPRLSLLVRLNKNASLTGTFARAFRRPTLNELYRAFRVGNVLTLSNENLRAERSIDIETAVIATGFSQRLYFRGGFFCTEISQTVSNVTLSVTPSLITRQRQNLGRTRSCGIEVDGQYRLLRDLEVSGGYLFVDPRVTSSPANVSLEGLSIPQVARHQFTLQALFADPKSVSLSLQLRGSSRQFDDDQNLLPLAGYFTADVLVSRRLKRGVEIFAASENLFDSKIQSGRTPVLTYASRRTVRIGIRLRLGGK